MGIFEIVPPILMTRAMSALPPKADIGTKPRNVRLMPKAAPQQSDKWKGHRTRNLGDVLRTDHVRGFRRSATCRVSALQSALPPKVDIAERRGHVRFVPITDIRHKRLETLDLRSWLPRLRL
jgi:hypothetical protein